MNPVIIRNILGKKTFMIIGSFIQGSCQILKQTYKKIVCIYQQLFLYKFYP
jgi:cytoskeletal protein CcmA (bactofilin family)